MTNGVSGPIVAALLTALTLVAGAPADTIHVPSRFGSIQAAIDAAQDGDTVVVGDGTYTGEGNRDIRFRGKAITVRSENGPATCIVA